MCGQLSPQRRTLPLFLVHSASLCQICSSSLLFETLGYEHSTWPLASQDVQIARENRSLDRQLCLAGWGPSLEKSVSISPGSSLLCFCLSLSLYPRSAGGTRGLAQASCKEGGSNTVLSVNC